jgi:hypothetical protein
MINHYNKNLFINKSTLARLAGVSPRTFRRYLATRRPILDAMGISPKAQKLPPSAVRYLCEDYCIDLPSSLQSPPPDSLSHRSALPLSPSEATERL